jgi:hypothetical protein
MTDFDLFCYSVECHSHEGHFVKCDSKDGIFSIPLLILMNVILLSIILLNLILCIVILLNVIRLTLILLNVISLSVILEFRNMNMCSYVSVSACRLPSKCHSAECQLAYRLSDKCFLPGIILLNVISLIVSLLNVTLVIVILQNAILLGDIILMSFTMNNEHHFALFNIV